MHTDNYLTHNDVKEEVGSVNNGLYVSVWSKERIRNLQKFQETCVKTSKE